MLGPWCLPSIAVWPFSPISPSEARECNTPTQSNAGAARSQISDLDIVNSWVLWLEYRKMDRLEPEIDKVQAVIQMQKMAAPLLRG
jgi:hypothetical protein